MLKEKKGYVCFPIDSELAENFGEGYYYCSGNTNDFGDGYEVGVEKSKYNDYLKQMQDGNEEWTKKLVYTLHIL